MTGSHVPKSTGEKPSYMKRTRAVTYCISDTVVRKIFMGKEKPYYRKELHRVSPPEATARTNHGRKLTDTEDPEPWNTCRYMKEKITVRFVAAKVRLGCGNIHSLLRAPIVQARAPRSRG